MNFTYRVRDSLGKEHSGEVEAATQEEAQQRLRRDGFTVLELSEEGADDGGLFPRRISKNGRETAGSPGKRGRFEIGAKRDGDGIRHTQALHENRSFEWTFSCASMWFPRRTPSICLNGGLPRSLHASRWTVEVAAKVSLSGATAREAPSWRGKTIASPARTSTASA